MTGPSPWHVLANDAFDGALVANTHPGDWRNPEPAPRYNLVVLGAGTAGLVAAVGAAALGARVALVERALLGGDCLTTGCVPSKAIIRSSRAAADVRSAAGYGVTVPGPVEIDFAAAMARLRRVRANISEHDSAARLKGLGVDVFLGEGRFVDGRRIEVAGRILKFAKALVATGARAAVPAVPGLAEVGFLTNETVFTLTRRPETLAVIGGGPVGCELAQAFARLGSVVTIIQRADRLLPGEEPAVSELLARVLGREGVAVLTGVRTTKVEARGGRKAVHVAAAGREVIVEAEEILVGAGRVPQIEGLGLEEAGIAFDPKTGIRVDRFLRTTNKRVFAAGDVCFPRKYTHAADATARIALQNALFLRSKRTSSLIIPRCVYTDPEIAHVGLTEAEARDLGLATRTYVRPLGEVDRAVVDGEEEGFARLLVRAGGDKILGATIVARHAGEMISEITALMAARKGLRFLRTAVIHPYPTQSEAVPQASSRYFEGLLKPRLRRLLARWFAWRR